MLLERIIHALEPLARGQECHWLRLAGDAEQWAYDVRQALHIARHHAVRYPELAAASFSINVIDSVTVCAQHKVMRQPSYAVLKGEATSCTVAEILPQMLPDARLYFPQTQLTARDFAEIAGCAQACDPPLMVLYDAQSTALTIAPDDPAVPQEARVQP